MKVGLLLISTSNGRPSWANMKDTYLYNIFTKTFLNTIDKENEYIVYIGIDKGDRILDNDNEQKHITRFSDVFKNVKFKFVILPETIKRGHVTVMWNIIHKQAYDEGCDYFYQCGDDISFKTKDWVNASIQKLQKHNNIGLTGPINNNNRILTQSFVSRKHMEIFGFYFPEEIKNWCCDDWYNWVYQPNHFYPLRDHYCSNDGGTPRYKIDNNKNFTKDFKNNTTKLREKTYKMAQEHKKLIT